MYESISAIDRRATMLDMRARLHYLKYYCMNIRLQSMLYGDEAGALRVEDGLEDYICYTKSIVQVKRQRTAQWHDPVLNALQKQQKDKDVLAKRDATAYVLLQGIAQLKEKERELLLDIYVRQYDRKTIMAKAGGIVESTYHRRLHQALIHLAILLDCVVYTNMKDTKKEKELLRRGNQ